MSSLLDKLRELIGALRTRTEVDVSVDLNIERFRTMTPQERAETLKAAATDWELEKGEKLDYERSIVDFMKLTGQDWSERYRRQLAIELGWGGDINDTAKMNQFLLPELRKRLEIAVG